MGFQRPFDAEARAQAAEWLAAWTPMGPILAARRVAELRELTEADSARIAVELLWPMVPPSPGDAVRACARSRLSCGVLPSARDPTPAR